MRLTGLLGRVVVTEAGERLGRIHDVRAEIVDGRPRITGVVAGRLGLLERYGVRTGGSADVEAPKQHGHDLIAWERVVRVGREVVVRAG